MHWLIDARPLIDPAQGGVSRVARGFIEAFTKSATENEIVLVTTGAQHSALPPTLKLLWAGSTQHSHIHIPIPNKLWSAACMSGLTSLDREVEKRIGKIDAIFLPNIGFTGPLGTRYSVLLHDLSFLIEPKWFSRKTRWWHKAVNATKLIKGAAHLLTVSETTKRDAVRLLGIAPEKISVIPIGSTINVIPREVGATRNLPIGTASEAFGDNLKILRSTQDDISRRYVLVLSATDQRKNARTAIAAVEELKRDPRFADIKLILVGRDIIRPTDNELASLYSNASAFLYPSWYEGYGLPLHEAAAFGTPRVASTAGALPETAPHGTIFADPAKPHHWVEALRIALSMPKPAPVATNPEHWNNAAAILQKTLYKISK